VCFLYLSPRGIRSLFRGIRLSSCALIVASMCLSLAFVHCLDYLKFVRDTCGLTFVHWWIGCEYYISISSLYSSFISWHSFVVACIDRSDNISFCGVRTLLFVSSEIGLGYL
jgi:hypothetical protein